MSHEIRTIFTAGFIGGAAYLLLMPEWLFRLIMGMVWQ